MQTIDNLATDLNEYLEPKQVKQVVRAYHFAKDAHKGQTKKSGEPYITHPLEFARSLSSMHMDHQWLMTAPLPDLILTTHIPSHL
ncbi:MAG: HD domain-containing protein, partial [Gammaproteobacteria bacterium]|nr:HD domain-containing protein [Gammaproteobacteria bacterium]